MIPIDWTRQGRVEIYVLGHRYSRHGPDFHVFCRSSNYSNANNFMFGNEHFSFDCEHRRKPVSVFNSVSELFLRLRIQVLKFIFNFEHIRIFVWLFVCGEKRRFVSDLINVRIRICSLKFGEHKLFAGTSLYQWERFIFNSHDYSGGYIVALNQILYLKMEVRWLASGLIPAINRAD